MNGMRRHPLAQYLDFLAQFQLPQLVDHLLRFERLEFGLELAQAPARLRAHRDAARQRSAQRPHDVDVGGYAVAGEAGADGLALGHLAQLVLHQVGQLQIFEEELQEFIAGKLEDEIVLTLPLVAGLAALPPPPPPRGRSIRSPATNSLLPGCIHLARCRPGRVRKVGSRDVALRDR